VERSGGVLTRGLVAGLIGATVLALWFFLVDVAQGAPFRTPAMVGGALFGIPDIQASPGIITLFTAIHYAAFLAVGVLAAWAVSFLKRVPNILFGVVLGFILFDGVFFGSVAVTGVDVVGQLGWVEVLTGNMLAGVAMMSFFHTTGMVEAMSWWEVFRNNRILREGLIAGVAAGVVVAAWFLLVDVIQGRPFFTPSAIGSVLFLGATELAQVEVSFLIAAAYTPIHFLIFILVAVAAAALALQAEKQPPLLIGVFLLFVAFEAFFLGIMAVVAQFLLGPLAWWSIAIGNLLGVLVMAAYLWKVHPQLRGVMGHEAIEHPA